MDAWSVRATIFHLNATGGVTSAKLATFSEFIQSYKASGINTITLTASIPVDPNTGAIESDFAQPGRWSGQAVTPQYVAAFTDVARAAGLQVIWKPQFIVDDGSGQNVADYTTPATFNAQAFLSNVQKFWTQWAPLAQQHAVNMLILGTEQGAYAGPQYDAQWISIIQTARASFGGQLTYASDQYSSLVTPQSQPDFWRSLDVIGIDDYAIIGNGTANTPYSEAYQHIFDAQAFWWNTSGRHIDIPGAFFNLHQVYNKPIFLTEFGITSVDGAMNFPAVASGNPNNTEQFNYFKANFDVFFNYDWIEGLDIWNGENEVSGPPSGLNFAQNQSQGWEWLAKPAEKVISGYWSQGLTPPPVHASSAHNPNGSFAGTPANPDILVGGFQNDTFDHLGGTYQIFAAGGTDLALFVGPSSNFQISVVGDATNVKDVVGTEGTGILHQVEYLEFSNSVFDTSKSLSIPNSLITTLQNEFQNIMRLTLSHLGAIQAADQVASGSLSEYAYVNQIINLASNTAVPAVAVEGSMYGAVGTSAEITLLATQFLPGQVANAVQNGLNTLVYASEALGLAFAFGNETGSHAFGNAFGPSNAALPNSTTGDAAYSVAASSAIFGPASTLNLVTVMQAFVANWKAFYATSGIPGILSATADQVDLAARGAAWGDAVGVALANDLGPLKAQSTNFLMDAAQGIASYSMSLVGQPAHHPFQGEIVT